MKEEKKHPYIGSDTFVYYLWAQMGRKDKNRESKRRKANLFVWMIIISFCGGENTMNANAFCFAFVVLASFLILSLSLFSGLWKKHKHKSTKNFKAHLQKRRQWQWHSANDTYATHSQRVYLRYKVFIGS